MTGASVRRLYAVDGIAPPDAAAALADELVALAEEIRSSGEGWRRGVFIMDNGERVRTDSLGPPMGTLERLGLLTFGQAAMIEGTG